MLQSIRAVCYSSNMSGVFPPQIFAFVVSSPGLSFLSCWKHIFCFEAQLKCYFIHKTRPKSEPKWISPVPCNTVNHKRHLVLSTGPWAPETQGPYTFSVVSPSCAYSTALSVVDLFAALMPSFHLTILRQGGCQGQYLNQNVGTGTANLALCWSSTPILWPGKATHFWRI